MYFCNSSCLLWRIYSLPHSHTYDNTERNLVVDLIVILNGSFTGSFFVNFVNSIQFLLKLILNQICWCLDSNCRFLSLKRPLYQLSHSHCPLDLLFLFLKRANNGKTHLVGTAVTFHSRYLQFKSHPFLGTFFVSKVEYNWVSCCISSIQIIFSILSHELA